MKLLALWVLLAFLALVGFADAMEERAPAIVFEWCEYAGRDAPAATPLPAGHYRNPIFAGFYPDPSLCRVGDDFYLVNSTFAYFPGIPIFHSRDLVHWTQLGHVIDRPSQLPYAGLEVSHGVFAPAISHQRGTFYVICTMVDGGGNFLVTAANPAGPWSDPVWLGFEGIDPSLFFDDDGRAWIVNNGEPAGPSRYDGHRDIWIQEFDPTAKKMIGPRRVLVDRGTVPEKDPVWIEGPHLFKRGEWYYLMCAEGGTAEGHTEVIFRGRAATGPFTPWERNPILTQRDLLPGRANAVTSTGHADLVQLADGSWWSVFLGCRPYDAASLLYATGRETFLLPVHWTDDAWPVILPPGQAVPLTAAAPHLPASPALIPLSGNFTARDDFAAPSLTPTWVGLRTPPAEFASLTQQPGALTLTARADDLRGRGHPAFLARRVQHADFTFAASMHLPATPGVAAGIAAFQNERFHFFLGARRVGEGAELFLERADDSAATVIARAVLPPTNLLSLRIECRSGRCNFSYATDATTWQTLAAGLDAALLTTRAAGGFVGAMVGPHARLEAR